MVSNIDPTKPVDGLPAAKADLRDNLQAAKDEIEALQLAQLPAGGSAGQFLEKASAADQDTAWTTVAELPAGGTTGQRLTKLSNDDFDVAWQTPGSVGGTEVPFGFVSPEDYGASGDGSDERTKLNDMFQDAKATGQGIWLPPGKTYHMGEPQITISSWSNFTIHGNGSTIKRHSSWTLSGADTVQDRMIIMTDCTHFRIYDLAIDGNRSVITPNHEHDHNLEFRDACTDFVCDGLRCINACGDGLYIAATPANAKNTNEHARRGKFINCVFDNAFRNGITIDYGHDLVYVNCEFTNTAGTNPRSGVDIEPILPLAADEYILGASNISFIGCRFADCEAAGLKIDPHGGSNWGWLIRGIYVLGCDFDHNGTINWPDNASINRAAIYVSGEEVQIIGNSFVNHTDGGDAHDRPKQIMHFADGPNGGVTSPSNFVVSGNTFKNNTACTHCIGTKRMIDGFRKPTYRGIISNNVFDLSDGMTLAQGDGGSPAGDEDNTKCAVSWQRDEVQIVGNYVLGDGTTDGIRIVTSSGSGVSASRRNVVDSNRIENCANAIVLPGSGITQVSVWGNYLGNNTTDLSDGGGGATRLGPQVSF